MTDSQPECSPNIGRTPHVTETSDRLTGTASSQLTLFAADSPVNRTLSPVAVLPPQTSAICGLNASDAFARYSPDGSWLRTCQGYSVPRLDGSSDVFSETWPRAGMTRNGIAYQRVPLAPLTGATASGLWPTASARDWKDSPGMAQTWTNPDGSTPNVGDATRGSDASARREGSASLSGAVQRTWPTPRAEDSQCASGHRGTDDTLYGAICKPRDGSTDAPGQLNPTWVEWLMGYPLGWTDCGDSATRSSRRSRSGSRNAFKP